MNSQYMVPKIENKMEQEVALRQQLHLKVESFCRARGKKMRNCKVTAVSVSKIKCTNYFKVNPQEMILITTVTSTKWTNY